jgi:surface protein
LKCHDIPSLKCCIQSQRARLYTLLGMFAFTRDFNQNIGDWNVTSVTTMAG